MIIVQGVFRVGEHDRERYLEESIETQRISRTEPGCLEYVVAADPLEPGRFVLSERWRSRADLDAHIAALVERRAAAAADGTDGIAPESREIVFFEAREIDVL
jgi:quinol monooxygenase YgiN